MMNNPEYNQALTAICDQGWRPRVVNANRAVFAHPDYSQGWEIWQESAPGTVAMLRQFFHTIMLPHFRLLYHESRRHHPTQQQQSQ